MIYTDEGGSQDIYYLREEAVLEEELGDLGQEDDVPACANERGTS
jgi:hypothetical protein